MRDGSPVPPITHVAITVRDLAVSAPANEEPPEASPDLDEDTGPLRHVGFALGDLLFGLHEIGTGEGMVEVLYEMVHEEGDGNAREAKRRTRYAAIFPDAAGGAFDEHRPGMDHLAFGAADRTELANRAGRLEELGITNGGHRRRPPRLWPVVARLRRRLPRVLRPAELFGPPS